MKKIFTEEELGEASEDEREEQEIGVKKRGAEDLGAVNSDEELPEAFTMTEGKNMVRQLRSEERASGRSIAAEVKKKKQERAAARKSEKASGKAGSFPSDEVKVENDETQQNGLLDDSIVQFLSECERAGIDRKVEYSPPKEPVKRKRSKSKKQLTTGRVQVVDLSQDSSFAEERNALEFKQGHLYGSRIRRDTSMLKSLAKVSCTQKGLV